MDNYVKLTRWPELQIGHVTYHFSSFIALCIISSEQGIYESDVFGYSNDSLYLVVKFSSFMTDFLLFQYSEASALATRTRTRLASQPDPLVKAGPGLTPSCPGSVSIVDDLGGGYYRDDSSGSGGGPGGSGSNHGGGSDYNYGRPVAPPWLIHCSAGVGRTGRQLSTLAGEILLFHL